MKSTMSPRAAFALGYAAVLGAGLVVASSSAIAATAPVGELYVANYIGGSVSQYATNAAGTAAALPYPTAPAGARPDHIIVSPNARWVYALDCNSGTIMQYTVDTSGLLTGALVPMSPFASYFGNCLASPTEPTGHIIAEAKSGKYVYVAGVTGGPGGLNTLLEFKVGTTGALTQFQFAETQSDNPNAVAVSPNGKFVYVSDPQGIIFMYTVSSTGTLTESGTVTSTQACLTDLAFAPSGKNLYATNNCTNQVTNLTANTTTGALTQQVNSGTGGSGASAVAVAPNAKTLYVTNANSNTVSQFSISMTGALSALSPLAVPVGAVKPFDLAVSPSSKNLYVANTTSNTVTEFAIGATNHLLTEIGVVDTGASPWGIAVRK